MVARLRSTDRLRVIAVYAEPYEIRPLLPPGAPVQSGIVSRWQNDHTAALYDGIAAALLRTTPSNRRHLVLAFTDGIDGTSVLSSGLLLEAAARSDGVLHVARRFSFSEQVRSSNPRSLSEAPLVWPFDPRIIERLARATGGAVTLTHEASVVSAFDRIIDTFRQRYILHYTPEGVAPEGWHEIVVRVTRPGRHDVDARRGYYAGDRR